LGLWVRKPASSGGIELWENCPKVNYNGKKIKSTEGGNIMMANEKRGGRKTARGQHADRKKLAYGLLRIREGL